MDDPVEWLALCARDPLRFVNEGFQWGAGELSGEAGPRPWQKEILVAVGEGLPLGEAIQLAVASGHGIGKSALVSWLILWAISTCEDTKGVVTATTERQLRTKTWAELGKWYRLFACKEFFVFEATCIYAADPGHKQTWRIDMIPWSENNTEAFAGLHNQGKRILLLMDEASGIADAVFAVAEGALTDENTEIIWAMFGNPTKNTGRFRDAFPGGKFSHRWKSWSIDSRTVPGTNKILISKWQADYGEDSDFFRIRVRGEFPASASAQFFNSTDIDNCFNLPLPPLHDEPLILGVDVARFGEDSSVIIARRGRDARSEPIRRFRGLDTVQFAREIGNLINALSPDAVFVDGGGVGGGVVDQLRALGYSPIEVQFGAKAVASEGELPANKRAEMYCNLRHAIKRGLALPNDEELRTELVSIEYVINKRDEIQLVSKEDMRRSGVGSPDATDALALTFAFPVYSRRRERSAPQQAVSEYNPYEAV